MRLLAFLRAARYLWGMEIKDPFAPLVGFDSAKAAQIASYFATRSDGQIEKLKLVKLMYLAERESLARHAHPMFYDELYSMQHGPVCSSVMDGLNGRIPSWKSYLSAKNNIIRPTHAISRDEMDEVSDADFAIIEDLWARFSEMTASQIRNYTHRNCAEYQEIESGRLPISYEDVFRAVGNEEGSVLAGEIASLRRLDGLFAH